MNVEEIKRLLDEGDIGDPGAVEEIDLDNERFRDDLENLPPETVLYLVGTASIFREPARAYALLRRSLPMIERRGSMGDFFRKQMSVWKGRRDKAQHDIEYLEIVLGVKEGPDPGAAAGS